MKKIIIIALMSVASMSIFAQSNSILVSGDAGFEFSKSNPGSGSVQKLTFNPMLGYQMCDNWTIGGHFGLTSYTAGSSVADEYQIGPFVRYSKKISDHFSLFADTRFGYIWSGMDNVNGWNLSLTPKAFINLSNNFGLVFDFGSLSYSDFGPTGTSVSTFEAKFGRTINVGIQKNFGLK